MLLWMRGGQPVAHLALKPSFNGVLGPTLERALALLVSIGLLVACRGFVECCHLQPI